MLQHVKTLEGALQELLDNIYQKGSLPHSLPVEVLDRLNNCRRECNLLPKNTQFNASTVKFDFIPHENARFKFKGCNALQIFDDGDGMRPGVLETFAQTFKTNPEPGVTQNVFGLGAKEALVFLGPLYIIASTSFDHDIGELERSILISGAVSHDGRRQMQAQLSIHKPTWEQYLENPETYKGKRGIIDTILVTETMWIREHTDDGDKQEARIERYQEDVKLMRRFFASGNLIPSEGLEITPADHQFFNDCEGMFHLLKMIDENSKWKTGTVVYSFLWRSVEMMNRYVDTSNIAIHPCILSKEDGILVGKTKQEEKQV